MKLEACIETIAEARIAAKSNLDRAELCTALDLGGLTPSIALTKACSEYLEIHAMVRPRQGNFNYSPVEVNLMQQEIRALLQAGATGVVFGCLTPEHEIDLESTKSLISKAKALELCTTFHRAFDFIPNKPEALETLIELGFNRILTSGGMATAEEGAEEIKTLVKQASGRIEIMAGSGVNSQNIPLFNSIGVDAVHFSIRKRGQDQMGLGMGVSYDIDPNKIESILTAIKA